MCVNKSAKPLLAIVGPTATGKTDVSVIVARNLNGEIISADSMLIYRNMDIGTAKPYPEERGGVPHYMIDVVNPDEDFNVSLYCKYIKNILDSIYKRKKLPLLVGGTGLYIRSVVDGYNFTEAGSDPELREKLLHECETMGKIALHEKLRGVDPESASRLHINDVKRVIRALEVYYLSGKTISESSDRSGSGKYNLKMFGLTMDRALLYERIEKRVDRMILRGLVDEVKSLLERGYSEELTSMQGLGYKEIILYLKGKMTLEEAVDLLKKRTRNFAKRQLTWFRRDNRIIWIDVAGRGPAEVAAEITAKAEGVFKPASND
ncbi:MAG: tRNA (adenosine(37)-N6)-dimethylallyltransferase MiaA [Bacillota bacterium]